MTSGQKTTLQTLATVAAGFAFAWLILEAFVSLLDLAGAP